MNTDDPGSAVEIVVRIDGQEVASCLANLPRPGLKAHLGENSPDNYEFDIQFDPPLSVFREFSIDVQVRGFTVRLPGWRRKLIRPELSDSRFTPVILTSTGRSGSTFLMKDLMRHPQIVAADRYPYEIKLIGYYSAAYKALASKEYRERSTNPDTMFGKENQYSIGHNPYNNVGLYSVVKNNKVLEALFESTIPKRFAETFQRNIEDYYTIIKRDSEKDGAAFFMEKGNIEQTPREGARLFFNHVREVVLVRDPRDMLCSARAFWNLPEDKAIGMMGTTLPRLEEIKASAGKDILFVRYEDLMTDQAAVRDQITQFIGIPNLAAEESEGGDAMLASHGTSGGGRSSIGRWREDLSDSDVGECEEAFSNYMDLFGYEKSRRRPVRHVIQYFAGKDALERQKAGQAGFGGASLPAVLDIVFQAGSNCKPYLISGWSPVEKSFVWSVGHRSELRFNRPEQPGSYSLRLAGRPLTLGEAVPSQRIRLSINGQAYEEVTLTAFSVLETELRWDLIGREPTVSVELECPDAVRPKDIDPGKSDDRLLGFSLERLTVFGADAIKENTADKPLPAPVAGWGAVPSDEMPLQELMLFFESLGENCEFGLVQRRCNADPIGLLRFSSTPLPQLLEALGTGFRGLGMPGNIEVQESGNGREYMVLDKTYGFLYHAWVMVGEQKPEDIAAREARRLPLLVRKILEEMTLGEKLFVYHGMNAMRVGDARKLSDALRSYGPTALLWTELADAGHAPGTVEWIDHGRLMKGYMDRFAPGENAHDLSLDCWIEVCRNAYRLWRSA